MNGNIGTRHDPANGAAASGAVAIALAALTGLAGLCAGLLPAAPTAAAQAANAVYTIGNYPVEARASDAVKAKSQAIADGKSAALRSLLKRLVPVSAYPQLRRLKTPSTSAFLDGVAVRSEQNSRTEYLASMDFLFRPKAVRALLRQEGIPFLDEQAQPVTVVPVYRPPPAANGASSAAAGLSEEARNWTTVWRDLDLTHALTPVSLRPLIREIHSDTITALLSGDESAYRIITSEYSSQFVVLAIAEPDPSTKRLNVTLVGRDAVDFFALKQSYRIQGDIYYAQEVAAVVALGVLEGRWKTTMVKSSIVGVAGAGGALAPVRFVVTYGNFGQWQDIRRRIAETPGVEQMEVAGQSARGATVSLKYPGGAEQLAQGLTQKGLYLRPVGGGWLLQGN